MYLCRVVLLLLAAMALVTTSAKASPFGCNWEAQMSVIFAKEFFAGIGPAYDCFNNLGLAAFELKTDRGGTIIDTLLLVGKYADLPNVNFGLRLYVSGLWSGFVFSALGLGACFDLRIFTSVLLINFCTGWQQYANYTGRTSAMLMVAVPIR